MSTVLKRFSLVGVAVALLATGCGTGPAKAGSAAIVGDSVIDLSLVQDRVSHEISTDKEMRKAHQNGKSDGTSRDVLTAEVLLRLTELAAQREGISVDETRIYDAVEELGGTGELAKDSFYSPDSVTAYLRAAYLRTELGKKYLAKTEVTLDLFYTRDGKEAQEKARQVAADPAKMDEFVRESPRSTSGAPNAAKDVKVKATEVPQLAGAALWSARPGTVVAFQVDEANSTWMVVLVKDRNDDASTAGTDPQLFERMDPRALGGFGLRIAQYRTADTKIEINPRYGAWNAAIPAVVPKPELAKGEFIAEVKQPKS